MLICCFIKWTAEKNNPLDQPPIWCPFRALSLRRNHYGASPSLAWEANGDSAPAEDYYGMKQLEPSPSVVSLYGESILSSVCASK